MKTNHNIINREDWDLARWFAILSPVIGILIGLLALFVLVR